MSEKELKKIEENESFVYDSAEIPPTDVIAYNELRSCSDLNRLMVENKIDIKPDFQRNVVWNDADQTRFIDSLSKQLPIPSMCFSLDAKTQEWKVIDGLQRMYTISRFFNDDTWKLSDIKDARRELKGKTRAQIIKENPSVYNAIENITLPITVLRCDFKKKSHLEYMFVIFRRLNEGGLRLNNQEIRNAIYNGSFNDLLKDLNGLESWGKIVSSKAKKDRLFTTELILRFFAFSENYKNYNGKLAVFLNDFMEKRRDLEKKGLDEKRDTFTRTINAISADVDFCKILKSKSNVVKETVLFGVANNLLKVEKNKINLSNSMDNLLRTDPFNESNIREGIFRKDKVVSRLELAVKMFSK